MARQDSSSADIIEESIDELNAQAPSNPLTIQNLRNIHSLWYRIHVFVYDLRNFTMRADCQSRLETVFDASYLGPPYFKKDEVGMLKAIQVDGVVTLELMIQKTIDERLERRMKERVESGDYRVCAAHDLAPIFEKAFDIKPRDLAKDRDFLTLLDQSGLNLKDGENWPELSRKSRTKQGQKKKKGWQK